ncbi:hypothetical protein [Aeromonas enteropelogenes]|uniref:hypothetical protein n=1 Tax=Aeromonas enteropelogenes TaxID=29489 RepID=UPI003BA03558
MNLSIPLTVTSSLPSSTAHLAQRIADDMAHLHQRLGDGSVMNWASVSVTSLNSLRYWQRLTEHLQKGRNNND